ncbi:hypothetical protein [Bradyrhizobium sp. WD16]|uniref:hypothetical protein n=1 Tax=Bradyrhizobium sp. WD16 TaxID=1521768 RepID=UPI0020A338CD|nr:hypothetical protein [Bradyrhizobium sp. WD16]UTD27521.1 hypothetical protein DB459_11885 [Bradyrhizobium sp. WD16]
MDLKTFVSQSLTQILDGIRDAQKRPGGENVAAEGYIGSEGNLMSGGTSGFFTRVDFDVLVLAETKDGKPSVTVGDTHIVENASSTDQKASRVRFAVHVRLPQGGDAINRSTGIYRAEAEYDPYNDEV